MPVQLNFGNGGLYALYQPVAHPCHAGGGFAHVGNGKLKRLAKANYTGNVLGTGAAAFFLLSAYYVAGQAYSLALIQHANALGAMELMAGDG